MWNILSYFNFQITMYKHNSLPWTNISFFLFFTHMINNLQTSKMIDLFEKKNKKQKQNILMKPINK